MEKLIRNSSSWPRGIFTTAFAHRSLVAELTRREIQGKYRGANFGMLWTLISPFLMLAVYALAFGNILRSRWPQADSGGNSFALILFVGLIIHGFFAECISRAPLLVVGNPNYVKRVVFPLEVLPWPMVLSALFHLFTSLIAFLVLQILVDHRFAWQVVLFPVTIAPLFVLAMGVSWWLAALGVYFRDIGQVTSVVVTALLFTSTAIMPLSAVAPGIRWLFELNPLTFIIDQSRAVALWGHFPDWVGLGLYGLVALLFAYLGYGVFMVTKRGFADVI
ncbi:ABC transporter permease [Dyella lutea]|uniref:Transport permease protein n=1 Tax=Dyella lutea TaxID=2950441 RepID=A0ABT1F7Q8_9GAMM|nr:ABC transporter permease [Dyella lutea]MCP1373422.1 ABC transporter permease [Dyella lutea]